MIELKINIGEKVKYAIKEFLNVASIFVGYEYDCNLASILDKIMCFVSDVCDLDSNETEEARGLVRELYSITKYSDYLLMNKNGDGISANLQYVGNRYFLALEKRNNKTWIISIL